jgi:hypothetical protein
MKCGNWSRDQVITMSLGQNGYSGTSKMKIVIVKNKAILAAQGYTLVEVLDFDERFAPVARLETIRILLAYATSHNIKLYQMDVKSAFLNGKINELMYVEQLPRFEDSKKPNHVYKLSNALYGLK